MNAEVRRHFDQAAECAENARVPLKDNCLAAAVNRIYYAMSPGGNQSLVR